MRRVGTLLFLLALPALAGCGTEHVGGARGGLREPVVRADDRVTAVFEAIAPEACRQGLAELDGRFESAAATQDDAAAMAVEAQMDEAVAACLARAPEDWDDLVEPLEDVATEAAGLVVRSTVTCDSPIVWERSDRPADDARGTVAGYLEDATGEVHLSPATCLHLAHVAAEPALLACVAVDSDEHWACPPSASHAADALSTLAHEAQHVSGVEDEAATECYALQTVDDLAVRLGVAEPHADPIGPYLLRVFYRPASYETPDCRRDGPLDIEPETPAFP